MNEEEEEFVLSPQDVTRHVARLQSARKPRHSCSRALSAPRRLCVTKALTNLKAPSCLSYACVCESSAPLWTRTSCCAAAQIKSSSSITANTTGSFKDVHRQQPQPLHPRTAAVLPLSSSLRYTTSAAEHHSQPQGPQFCTPVRSYYCCCCSTSTLEPHRKLRSAYSEDRLQTPEHR
eukprot:3548715-Rhodomonas_salina.1